MTDTTKKSRIPEFKTVQEEAEFWDTHDLSDYWDEFKTANVRFSKNLSEGITIRFDPQTLGQLREQARAKGIGATTLIRMWILERLNQSSSAER